MYTQFFILVNYNDEIGNYEWKLKIQMGQETLKRAIPVERLGD